MADAEPEVVEQFHGVLACSRLGERLIDTKKPRPILSGRDPAAPQRVTYMKSFCVDSFRTQVIKLALQAS